VDWSTRVSSLFGWLYLHQGGRLDSATGLYYFRNRDYSPTLGRWMQQDPLGYDAGDSNLYRDVNDGPTNATDSSGLEEEEQQPPQFDYQQWKGATFNGDLAGYNFGLDIKYPTGGVPQNGSFLQVNKLRTVVVTADKAGNLQAQLIPTKYIKDVARVTADNNGTPKPDRYHDTLAGPDFDAQLGQRAILVFSFVEKKQGFTCDLLKPTPKGEVIGEAEAKKIEGQLDKRYSKGTYSYGYLYVYKKHASGKLPADLSEALKKVVRGADDDLGKKLTAFEAKVAANPLLGSYQLGSTDEHRMYQYENGAFTRFLGSSRNMDPKGRFGPPKK
jgi:RHS repeat-associated protein